MAWFADLAGKAESLLNNLDEQTGAALRSHNGAKKKNDKSEFSLHPENPPWNQQKRRPVPKNNTRKPPQLTETRSNNCNPTRKLSPNSRQSRSQTKDSNDYLKEPMTRKAKSPARKPAYSLNHCPDTLVGDVKDNESIDQFGLKHRRFSLPADLEIMHQDNFTYKMQNLEVENAMLKNELNVMNREVSELLDRLRNTEDGNDVVSDKDLHKINLKLENTELINNRVQTDKASLTAQLEQLKRKVNNLMSVEIARHKEQNKDLQLEVNLLRDRNHELEDLVRQLNEKITDQEVNQTKLENELRHAQTNIKDLESNLEKTITECRRLEKDWDSYKLRVKSMLHNKDNEIRALQEGLNLTEDTKILMEQIEALKEEREELSEAVARVRSECSDMRRHVEQLEARHGAAERVVAALRDALRDERAANTRAEAQCAALGKELKALEHDTGHTISSLRAKLREKDDEIAHLKESSVRSSNTSALNVADYDELQGGIDSDKIHYLTQTLVQRQGKIDSLLADNNMLRIQMDKLESKYKSELSSLRAQNTQKHSVVQVQDEGRSRRARPGASALGALSRRLALAFNRYPVFRVFMLFYMLGLHFWVLTVLLTSTPEGYVSVTRQKTIPNEG